MCERAASTALSVITDVAEVTVPESTGTGGFITEPRRRRQWSHVRPWLAVRKVAIAAASLAALAAFAATTVAAAAFAAVTAIVGVVVAVAAAITVDVVAAVAAATASPASLVTGKTGTRTSSRRGARPAGAKAGFRHGASLAGASTEFIGTNGVAKVDVPASIGTGRPITGPRRRREWRRGRPWLAVCKAVMGDFVRPDYPGGGC